MKKFTTAASTALIAAIAATTIAFNAQATTIKWGIQEGWKVDESVLDGPGTDRIMDLYVAYNLYIIPVKH